ncbi:aspartate--tRNA(Asn) ligase [Patescibacteria group bacterium]|nr:MAG: aspartate--tRNA(Asn) ligase [Patescibacteria group bacterium]
MKKTIHTREVSAHAGKTVTLQGFVHALRVQSKIIFLILRDVTGTIQVVIPESSHLFEHAKNLSLESVVRVAGLAKEEKNAPGGVEIHPDTLEVLSSSAPELPIPVVTLKGGDETESPTRFDFRWIDLRKPEKIKIFKIWTEFEKGFRKFWYENDFIQIYTPSFMSTPSESGADVFEVDYFDRKAYLAQSPQFYKQMAIASGFERVFMVGPVFRAEPSFTTRHLTEFTGWDFEVAYIDSHHDLMDLEERMIISGFQAVSHTFPEIALPIPTQPFPRIPMVEAKKILRRLRVISPEEHDLSPEEERALSVHVTKEMKHEFVFVTDYHKSMSAFYHMRHPDDPDRARRADLLFRGVEVTTLAQREHRPEILEKQAKEKGLKLEPLADYLNFFRYGCPPHGGAGIGPGRFIMSMLNLGNIREATFLPRDVKRLNP